MSTRTAIARPWAQGWELHVEGVGVTQVRVLEHAEQQVRDLIETMTGQESDEPVSVSIDLGPLTDRVADARALTQQAADLQRRAAAESRSVVTDLRQAGLSISDIAFAMGVSRGRISQLIAANPSPRITVDYEHKHRRKPQRKSA